MPHDDAPAASSQAHGAGHRFWHALREHATHWAVGGAILALTGFAPEEWLARTVDAMHLPANALHLWGAGIDPRIIAVIAGMA